MIIPPSSTTFESVQAGVHTARLFRIADLGTQTSTFEGKETKAHKIMFTWEILSDERMSTGQPFSVSRRMTASLNPKSALFALIASWRGRALSDEDIKAGFNIEKLLGQFCLLNLTESEREGRVYTNVTSVMPLPKNMPKPDPVNEVQIFNLNKPDWNVFDGLSERIKETIMTSPEYQAAQGWGQPDPAPKPTPSAPGETFEDDDIPF